MRTELGCLLPAPGRRRHEKGELLGRVVRLIRHPPSRAMGTGMNLDALLVQEDLGDFLGSLRPYFLSNIPRRQRVVGLVEDDVVVGVDGALLPQRALEGGRRK